MIIIDNYNAENDVFIEQLTSDAPYRVLVTAIREPERGKYHVIPIKEIDDDALREMVCEYANPDSTPLNKNDPAFTELFDLTNRHTLTLELIAKYMDEKCIDDVSEMVELLKEKKLAVLKDSKRKDSYSTIHSLFKMTDLTEEEKTFLCCLAMMPPVGVDSKMFKGWCGSDVFKKRSKLAGLSLIKVCSETKTLSLHLIIKDVIVMELKPDYNRCIAFLENYRKSLCENTIWNASSEEKDIYFNINKAIVAEIPLAKESFKLYYNVSVINNFSCDFNNNYSFMLMLYDFACDNFGEKSMEAGMTAFRIMWLHTRKCEYEDSLNWGIIADNILQSYKYEAANEYTHNLVRISFLYSEMTENNSQFDLAMEYANKAYAELDAIYKEALAKNDNETADLLYERYVSIYTAKINIYIKKSDYTSAQNELDKTIQHLESYKNNTHDMAHALFIAGRIKFLQNQYSEAIPLLNKARDLAIKSYKFNPRLIDIDSILAKIYLRYGNTEDALLSYKNALEVAKQIYTHRNVRILSLLKEISRLEK